MRRIITIALVLCLITTPCHALTVFQTDYDGDEWTETVVYEGDWLPLRKLSETLPYEVEWSEQERTIYIYAERTWEIKPDWYLPEGVMIRDGVTYVSPAYMKRLVPNSFLFRTGLYVFAGETKRSALVRGEEDFRREVLTTMYRLRLALPEDYRLIRDCLTGGIEQSKRPGFAPENAAAYVYPTRQHPTAYIIADPRRANLAELIAHEAYHVHLTRRGRDSEDAAEEYGRRVAESLLIN